MVAEAGMKLNSHDALAFSEGKFSGGGWSWNEADSTDALGLTEGKFSYGG